MPSRRIHFSLILLLLLTLALNFHQGTAHAAGFMLMEQSVSGLGNAFAGGAAAAEDATTIYYNPAGLTRLEGQQAVVDFHFIRTSFSFENHGSTHALTPITGEGLIGPDGGDAGQWNVASNGYYALKLDNAWALGLGLNIPFGLTTDYDEGWVGRYHALRSEIQTININPSVAFRVKYRSTEKTFTDEEVNKAHARIVKTLQNELGAEIR